MNLMNPAALVWGLIALPIVILYILKVRMRRIPTSTVMFWEQVFEEKQPRSIWQKLRHLLSLLLQLAFLALLVGALVDPFFDWEVREQRRIVLVIDNSASMQATDVEPSRFDEAKKQVAQIIRSLRVRDEMAILTAGTQPKVVCGLTGHQKTLHDSLQQVVSTDGPTRVTEAIELGRRLLAEHENGSVVVVSDGCFVDAETVTSSEDVTWLPIGGSIDNVAITRFQVRRSLLDPLGYQVLAEVRNFSDEEVECRLELELDDDVVDVLPLRIEPAGKWSDVFTKTSAAGGRLKAVVQSEDSLAADNEAWAILPERKRQKVILVGDGNLFLERVFEANSLVDLTVASELPEAVPSETIIVFHREVPETLPAGNVVVLEPTKATDLWELGETIDDPIVAKQDKESELMAYVRLDNVMMPEARKLIPTGEASVLVEAGTGDALYLSMESANRKLIVLTVNLERGDLPLRTAFPIMFSNALSWFEGSGGELRESVATGAITRIELPENLKLTPAGTPATELQLLSPNGLRSTVPVTDESVTIGPLEQRGVWKIGHPAEQGDDESEPSPPTNALMIAGNVADPQESALNVVPEKSGTKTVTTAGFSRPIWFYLIALAWLLTGMEWFLYQRRFIS